MNWRDHISVQSEICHGQACLTGTRVLVSVVLDNLADGATPAEIVASYPSVTLAGVEAAVRYAAELTRDRYVPLSPGAA